MGVSLSYGPRSDLSPSFVRVRWLRHPFGLLGLVHPVPSLRGRLLTNVGYGVIFPAGG